jgi:hypothetical protein
MKIGHGLIAPLSGRSLSLRLLIFLRRNGRGLSGFAVVIAAGRSVNHLAALDGSVGFASGNGNHQNAQERSRQ